MSRLTCITCLCYCFISTEPSLQLDNLILVVIISVQYVCQIPAQNIMCKTTCVHGTVYMPVPTLCGQCRQLSCGCSYFDLVCPGPGKWMPTYLQCLREPNTEAVQLAGSALLQFLFLLLHTLLASHQFNQHTSVTPQSKESVQLPLSSLSENVIGNLTAADAQWCAPEAVLRHIGMTIELSFGASIWHCCN